MALDGTYQCRPVPPRSHGKTHGETLFISFFVFVSPILQMGGQLRVIADATASFERDRLRLTVQGIDRAVARAQGRSHDPIVAMWPCTQAYWRQIQLEKTST